MDIDHAGVYEGDDDGLQLPPLASTPISDKRTTASPVKKHRMFLPPMQLERSSQSSRRKRPRFQSQEEYNSIPTSSDPALFSGDEQSDHAENYSKELDGGGDVRASKRKKKLMYSGSWWNHKNQAERYEKRREFQRNLDSGIFMGSEDSSMVTLSSDSLADELIEDQKVMEQSCGATKWNRMLNGKADSEVKSRSPGLSMTAERNTSPGMQAARTIIGQCLDQLNEVVDLSSLSLSCLPPEISQLEYLTKDVQFHSRLLKSGTSLETELQLYLANNRLTRLPRPVLQLDNLHILSLRQNKLTSIPPGIVKLVNLRELNIAGNQLQTLPFEICELVTKYNLTKIVAHPNPWLPPPEVWNENTRILATGYRVDRYVRRNSIDAMGNSVDLGDVTSVMDTRMLMMSSKCHETINPAKYRPGVSPSLIEVVLRQLARMDSKVDLLSLMPVERTSEAVLDKIRLVQPTFDELATNNIDLQDEKLQQKDINNGVGLDRTCTSCYRQIVQPGREWIEWWMWSFASGLEWMKEPSEHQFHRDDGEPVGMRGQWSYIPFVRMQCHASCKGNWNPIYFDPANDCDEHHDDDRKGKKNQTNKTTKRPKQDQSRLLSLPGLVSKYLKSANELCELRPEWAWRFSVPVHH